MNGVLSDYHREGEPYNNDFSAKMNMNGLTIENDDTRQISVLTYFAREVVSLAMEEGMYYMKITLVYGQTNETYYSDVFFVKDASKLDKCVCIKWRNEENLEYDGGFIPYGELVGGEPFTNRLYLDTTIAMPSARAEVAPRPKPEIRKRDSPLLRILMMRICLK